MELLRGKSGGKPEGRSWKEEAGRKWGEGGKGEWYRSDTTYKRIFVG
jgi:hypothetical protein